jgi:hypothetical protein
VTHEWARNRQCLVLCLGWGWGWGCYWALAAKVRDTIPTSLAIARLVQEVFKCRVVLRTKQHGLRVLEKLTVAQLVKKYPTLYGIGRFGVVFTRAHKLWETSYAVHVVWKESRRSSPEGFVLYTSSYLYVKDF